MDKKYVLNRDLKTASFEMTSFQIILHFWVHFSWSLKVWEAGEHYKATLWAPFTYTAPLIQTNVLRKDSTPPHYFNFKESEISLRIKVDVSGAERWF